MIVYLIRQYCPHQQILGSCRLPLTFYYLTKAWRSSRSWYESCTPARRKSFLVSLIKSSKEWCPFDWNLLAYFFKPSILRHRRVSNSQPGSHHFVLWRRDLCPSTGALVTERPPSSRLRINTQCCCEYTCFCTRPPAQVPSTQPGSLFGAWQQGRSCHSQKQSIVILAPTPAEEEKEEEYAKAGEGDWTSCIQVWGQPSFHHVLTNSLDERWTA